MNRVRSWTIGSAVAMGAGCALAVACGAHSSNGSSFQGDASTASVRDGSTSSSNDASSVNLLGGDASEVDGGVANGSCQPPDVLIVLDRSLSMAQAPGGAYPTVANAAQSKYELAVKAIDAIVEPADAGVAIDTTINFGLEVLPVDEVDGGVTADGGRVHNCGVVANVINASNENPSFSSYSAGPADYCSVGGQPLISPAPGNGAAIASVLSPSTFLLCGGTPIAGALSTAATTLASTAAPGKKQVVILITDGEETCGNAAITGGIMTVQSLAAEGIETYVIGFGKTGSGGVDIGQLNNLACAGGTAMAGDAGSGDAGCKSEDGGYAAGQTTTPVFVSALDGTSIESALEAIKVNVCCGCVH